MEALLCQTLKLLDGHSLGQLSIRGQFVHGVRGRRKSQHRVVEMARAIFQEAIGISELTKVN